MNSFVPCRCGRHRKTVDGCRTKHHSAHLSSYRSRQLNTTCPCSSGSFADTPCTATIGPPLIVRSLLDTSVVTQTMANVHSLYSDKDSDDEKDESNNRYVGGIGERGGGRCVAIETLVFVNYLIVVRYLVVSGVFCIRFV